jgi:peptidoglycan hydrolase-like protein with peptidoglycan-binding domain
MPSTTTSTTTLSTTTTTIVLKEILNLEDAQYQLYELGFYTGEINGVLDTNTKTAIKEFQKLSGLVVDGILGPITKAALEKGGESYITNNNQAISVESSKNSALDLRYYNPNENCITGYVNSSQVWVPDPCFYPVFVYRYGQTAQVNSQAELDAYLSQNWSLTQEKIYNSLGEVPTQNYISGINSPVNGLPMPSGSNNSIVIGIKNDNNVRARPQSGPQKADAVFEVLVEGGMTRFINIFYQSDTSYHGPIRSARPTDPTVLRPLGGVLVASGATGGLIPEINDMGVPVITDRRPEYFRISSRKAPHNLYADTTKLKSIAISKGYKKVNIPQPLFPWGDPTFENWQNNSFLNLVFSGYTETTWTWNGSSYLRTYYDAYQNQNKNNLHNWLDENGNTGQISVDTVIALFCEPYVHPLQLPSVKTVGEGRAIILHGGKMLDAKWKRGSNLDPFHITDNNNNILYVPKGKVWISLVPNTKNPSFG